MDQAILQSNLFGRSLILYAISLTMLGSLFAVGFMRVRTWIDSWPLPETMKGTEVEAGCSLKDGHSEDLLAGADATAVVADGMQPSSASRASSIRGSARLSAPSSAASSSDDGLPALEMIPKAPLDEGTARGSEELNASSPGPKMTAEAATKEKAKADRAWLVQALGALERIVLRRAAYCQVFVLLEATLGWGTRFGNRRESSSMSAHEGFVARHVTACVSSPGLAPNVEPSP